MPVLYSPRLVAELQNAADGFDCLVDSLGDFAIGRFQRASASSRFIKLAGKPGAVAAQDVNLLRQLDEATARAGALEAANREVAQRIGQAIETIRGVLEFGN